MGRNKTKILKEKEEILRAKKKSLKNYRNSKMLLWLFCVSASLFLAIRADHDVSIAK